MKVLRFENLIDTNTGKTLEVESLEEIGRLGGESAQKLTKMFSNHGFVKHD